MQIDTTAGRPADPSRSTEDIKSAAQDTAAAVDTALHETTDRLKQAASGAKDQAREKVDAGTDGAAASLRQVSDQLKAAVDGLGGEQPWAGQAFQTGADGLDRVSDYLASGKFDDFARDIQTFAKSNPAAFLAGSVALGFLLARVSKTAVHHAAETSAPPPAPSPTSGDPVGLDDGFAPHPIGGL